MKRPKHEHLKNSRKNIKKFHETAGTLDEMANQLTKDAGTTEDQFTEALSPIIKDMVGLVQIATLGNVQHVKNLLNKPGEFLENVMKEDQGRLLGYLQIRGFYEVATRPSNKDPLDWAKLQLEIAQYQDKRKMVKGGGNGGIPGDVTEGRDITETPVFNNELLRAVAPASEDPGSGGDG